MTELLQTIQTMISSETDDLAQVERTLTDGYAHALELEAERARLERQIAQVTQGIEDGDTAENARELASLTRRLHGNTGALASLRPRLADLRGYASGLRGSER
jgi:HPt (histidine-containing phosphotransfer) domain-containing protein